MKYPEILAIRPEPVVVGYSAEDTMFYALSLGLGEDPTNAAELPFVYEEGLRALPTMTAILGHGAGEIAVGGGLDFAMMLHGEQRLRMHRPLPPSGRLRAEARCLEVVDKGADKGALVHVEEQLADAETGALYATVIMSLFCRADGGVGGAARSSLVPHETPARAPDRQVAIATRPNQALLYRLNGDMNPLHADPRFARKVGFERPILHGLCTYGIACRAVLQACCDYDPARIAGFDVRFASPVYPGETIVTRLWEDGAVVSFECVAAERGVTVIRNGRCELAA